MARRGNWTAIVTLVLAIVLPVSGALAVKKSPRDRLIEKCDNELAVCKSECDRTQIDIDNQIQQCKDKCERERVLCTPDRVQGPPGNVGDIDATPGVDASEPGSQVCCRISRGSKKTYVWVNRGSCKGRERVVMPTPAKCPAVRSQ
jgi:hypothetical protein